MLFERPKRWDSGAWAGAGLTMRCACAAQFALLNQQGKAEPLLTNTYKRRLAESRR